MLRLAIWALIWACFSTAQGAGCLAKPKNTLFISVLRDWTNAPSPVTATFSTFLGTRLSGSRAILVEEQTALEQLSALECGTPDLVFTDPILYSCFAAQFGLAALLTGRARTSASAPSYTAYSGGSVLVPASSGLRALGDLGGATVAVGEPFGLGAVALLDGTDEAILHEASQIRLVTSEPVLGPLSELLAGRVDAAAVPSLALERLLATSEYGPLLRGKFRVLNQTASPDGVGSVSGRALAGWALAASSGLSDALREEVVTALLSLDDGSAAGADLIRPYGGFTLPKDYSYAFTLGVRLGFADLDGQCLLGRLVDRSPAQLLHNATVCAQGFTRRPWLPLDSAACPGPRRVTDFGPSDLQLSYECFESPCLPTVTDFEVQAVGLTDAMLDRLGLAPQVHSNRSVACSKSSACTVVEQFREMITLRVVDRAYERRIEMGLPLIKNVTYQTEGLEALLTAAQVAPDAWELSFTPALTGPHLLVVFADGMIVDASPVAFLVVEMECPRFKVGGPGGVCVCGEGLERVGGLCLQEGRSVIIGTTIGIAAFVIIFSLAFWRVYDMRSLLMIMIDPSDLYIPHPVKVLGYGTFGTVVLGVYNGTEVAIKSLTKPRPKREKRRSLVEAFDRVKKMVSGRVSGKNGWKNSDWKSSELSSGAGFDQAKSTRSFRASMRSHLESMSNASRFALARQMADREAPLKSLGGNSSGLSSGPRRKLPRPLLTAGPSEAGQTAFKASTPETNFNEPEGRTAPSPSIDLRTDPSVGFESRVVLAQSDGSGKPVVPEPASRQQPELTMDRVESHRDLAPVKTSISGKASRNGESRNGGGVATTGREVSFSFLGAEHLPRTAGPVVSLEIERKINKKELPANSLLLDMDAAERGEANPASSGGQNSEIGPSPSAVWSDRPFRQSVYGQGSVMFHMSRSENEMLSGGAQGPSKTLISKIGYKLFGCIFNGHHLTAMSKNRAMMREIRLVSSLRHRNIVTVVGAVFRNEPLLVTELMENGSLYDLVHNETFAIESDMLLQVFRDVISGIRFLHNRRPLILHNDIKSKNVLVDENFTAKLADFGLSTLRKANGRDDGPVGGTPFFSAPEVLRGESPSPASDIFSFGILLYECISRKDPYEGENYIEVIRALREENPLVPKRPMIPKCTPKPMVDLMRACWEQDPAKRPTADEVKAALDKMVSTDLDTKVMDIETGEGANRRARSRKSIIAERSLLRDVFPPKVAEALREGKTPEPESYDSVTIYFSDVVSYTDISSSLPPLKVMDMLSRLYRGFDRLCLKHGMFKVETVGDAYLCVGGLPERHPDHVRRAADFSLDAIEHASRTLIDVDDPSRGYVRIRVGLHTGPVVAAVVGERNARYCLFGDTVNTAARMETNSDVNRVHMSSKTADMLRLQSRPNEYKLQLRGDIQVKGKGTMRTWWLNGKEPSLSQPVSHAGGAISGHNSPSINGAMFSGLGPTSLPRGTASLTGALPSRLGVNSSSVTGALPRTDSFSKNSSAYMQMGSSSNTPTSATATASSGFGAEGDKSVLPAVTFIKPGVSNNTRSNKPRKGAAGAPRVSRPEDFSRISETNPMSFPRVGQELSSAPDEPIEEEPEQP